MDRRIYTHHLLVRILTMGLFAALASQPIWASEHKVEHQAEHKAEPSESEEGPHEKSAKAEHGEKSEKSGFMAATAGSSWKTLIGWFSKKEVPTAQMKAANREPAGLLQSIEEPGYPGGMAGVTQLYGKALISLQEKADKIMQAEREAERLRLENVNLRVQAENLQYNCAKKEASKKLHEIKLKMSMETGSEVGRTLATIDYRPPTHLLPTQLYTLGLSYLKSGDDEKAAVIFTFLTGTEEIQTYKRSQDYLVTGIAWYRLKNYELADQYFARALKSKGSDSEEYLKSQAQARLWRALVAVHQNKRTKAQYWLADLVDHHPHSMEAEWVNPQGGREPASEY